MIEDNNKNNGKVFIKTIIQGKNISKNLNLKKQNLSTEDFYKEVVTQSKKELINLIKRKKSH